MDLKRLKDIIIGTPLRTIAHARDDIISQLFFKLYLHLANTLP
jgi:hypothetical protein